MDKELLDQNKHTLETLEYLIRNEDYGDTDYKYEFIKLYQHHYIFDKNLKKFITQSLEKDILIKKITEEGIDKSDLQQILNNHNIGKTLPKIKSYLGGSNELSKQLIKLLHSE